MNEVLCPTSRATGIGSVVLLNELVSAVVPDAGRARSAFADRALRCRCRGLPIRVALRPSQQ